MKFFLSCLLGLIIGANITGQTFKSTPELFGTFVRSEFVNGFSNGHMNLEMYCDDVIEKDWIVYSDRNKNVLYYDPNGDSKNVKLDFMEPLKVKEVKGNWLLVYSYHKKVEKSEERGWVHAKNLILSRYSLLNKKGIQKKAMILVSVDKLIAGSKNANEIFSKSFYDVPSAQLGNRNGKKAEKMTIYFIIKESEGAVLLAQVDNLKHTNIQELKADVHGWMPKGAITPWDHRICLELNTSENAVQSYGTNEIAVFNSRDSLEYFLSNQVYLKNNVIKKYELSTTRQKPTEMRMPILDHYIKNNKIKKVASIARIGTEDSKTKDRDQATVKEKIIEISNRIEKVDILFVVDATQSMGKYYSSIAKSIENIIESQQGENYKLRFGLAVYRDYPDGKGKEYELTPLTSDQTKVIERVKEVQCMSSDHDAPEAQFQGLVKGINECGFNPGNSNVVVLIGDAGNHENDEKYALNDVTDALYKFEASFVSFQVHRGDDYTYSDFNLDIQKIIRSTGRKYVNEKSNAKLEKSTDGNTYRLKFNQKSEEENLYMFGRYTYASGNKNPMPTEILEENIEESIAEYINRASNIKARLEGALSGEEAVFTDEFINLLKRRGLSDYQIELLKKEKEITALGYTSMSMYGKPYSCYSEVVFLSGEEKDRMTKVLGELVNKTRSTTKRKKAFQNALAEQCSNMLGQSNNGSIMDFQLNEIWRILLASDFPNKSMGIKTLRELDQLNDIEFEDFYVEFEDMARVFSNSDFHDSRYERGDNYFYWIPLSEFPGSSSTNE